MPETSLATTAPACTDGVEGKVSPNAVETTFEDVDAFVPDVRDLSTSAVDFSDQFPVLRH